MPDYEMLKVALEGIEFSDAPGLIKQKSRDFYWYSPILKEELENVRADIVVSPADEAELIRVLKAAYALGVPVTARGGGTGNYGQCMPLSGGIVLDMLKMDQILLVEKGRVIAQPGVNMAALDRHLRAVSDQELRFHPSTNGSSSLAGFICGGSGGVGSIHWGTLRELGNILRLRVVTLEAEPQVLELTGDDIQKVAHAYGTNGIITEVELPLAPAYDWVDVILGFGDYLDAARFADAASQSSGMLLKELAVIDAPAPFDYFIRHKPFLQAGEAVVLMMVAPQSMGAVEALAGLMGAAIRFRSDRDAEGLQLPHVYELAWNHTTLRALKLDEGITYLQVLYPGPDHLAQIARMREVAGPDVNHHLELIRFGGGIQYTELPILHTQSKERIAELIALYEANGCVIFDPHRYTLEEGGMKQTDAVQLDFKRQTDPKGLLNPGKMIAWDDPEYDFTQARTYFFRGLAGQEG